LASVILATFVSFCSAISSDEPKKRQVECLLIHVNFQGGKKLFPILDYQVIADGIPPPEGHVDL
jgi:hypothetical protein